MATPPAAKTRSTIYIDGFNFYFGIFANKPAWKWLNIQTFFEALRPRDEITIKYFTAVLDPKKTYSARRERQQHPSISDLLPFRRLWCGEPDAITNAIGRDSRLR